MSATRLTMAVTAAAGLASAGVTAATPAQAAESFYKTHNVTLYVGSAPGGGYDSYARVLARHMGSHLPGSPTFIVKNMPGASGLRLGGYMYNKAARDGSEIAGVHNTIVLEEIMGHKVQFKATDFNWLGSANQLTSTCVVSNTAPAQTIREAMKKEVVVGGTGSTSSSTILMPAFLNSLIGTKFKIIRGYPSSSSVLLAMERGEVGGLCGIGWDSLQTQAINQIKSGEIKMIVEIGKEPNPELKGVPFALDLAPTPQIRKILDFLVARQYIGRPYLAPPGVAADRVKVLRTAFTDTMHDPKYRTDAGKAHLPLSPVSGEKVQTHIENWFNTPAEIIARADRATSIDEAQLVEAKLNWITAKGVKIDRVKHRNVYFTDDGKGVSAELRGTKVTIDGKKASRKAVAAGMTCDVTYLGNGDVAKSMACKK